MPQVDLVGSIPGVELSGPFDVSVAGGETVEVRLTDAVLHQGPDAALSLTASYDTATDRLVLERAFTPAVAFAGGQLELNALTLTVRCQVVAGRIVLDAGAARPVEAVGAAGWIGEAPQVLGAPNGRIPLQVEYGEGAFAVRLAAPVELTAVSVELTEAAIGVEVLLAEQALVLTLRGQAALRGQLGAQIAAALERILDTAPALDPPAFRFRRTYRLVDLVPLGAPTLSLLPPLPAGSAMPGLPVPPAGLDVTLGLPQIDFALGNGVPSLGLRFRDCSLAFPSLAGLEAFRIDGQLNALEDAAGALLLSFEPTAPGAVNLPAAFRFFLARIEWLAAAVDLGDLPDLMALSQDDHAWYELFRSLLPDPGDPIDPRFRAAFDDLLTSALALASGPDRLDLFALALAALADRADDVYGLVIGAFAAAGTGVAELAELLMRLSGQLSGGALDRLLAGLFAAFDPQELFAELLALAGRRPLDTLDDFLALWIRVLAGALTALDPDALAQALVGAVKGAGPTLQGTVSLSALPVFRGVPGLDLSAFNLPLGSALAGLGIGGLVTSSDLPTAKLSGSSFGAAADELFSAMGDALLALLAPFSLPKVDATMVLGLMIALFTNADGDQESEVILLQWARIPFFGWVLPVAASIRNLATPAPWTDMLWQPIENQPGAVKHLPAPGPSAKYLIFSDLHRDAAADRLPAFRTGATSHFLDNQRLYLDVLGWADDEGYTVLEAGDCEELWFIRDFSTYAGPADQLQQVMDTHTEVYDKLVELHRDGRYLRLFGNHDSHLRDQAVRQALVDRFEGPAGSPPFEIHDFFVIPGVKTMDDHGLLDLTGDIVNGVSAEDRVSALIEGVSEGRLGLDSEPYTTRGKLIVTHGHQFDFWNCDSHNLAGKMIANAIGVPVDSLDDPLQDLGGIAFGGAPLIDFQKVLGRLPVFSNFPAYDASREFAHTIQHSHESDRVLVNDIFYWEAIPALMAAFAMPLDQLNDDGSVRLRWSDADVDPAHPERFPTQFLGHAICVGHTHFPQSRPYYDIARLLLGSPAKEVVDLLRDGLAELMFGIKLPINFIRSQYYNSGTVGWMEGVIWAIQVDEHGQARLVYWTRDTKVDCPQEMDWELQRWDPQLREALAARRETVATEVNAWIKRFENVILAAAAGAGSLSTVAVLGLSDLLAHDIDRPLEEIDPASTSAADLPDVVRDATSSVAEIALQLVLALLAHQLSAAAPPRRLKVSVPLSPTIAERLDQLQSILAPLPDVAGDAVLHHAAVWLTISEQLPFVNGGPSRVKADLATVYPVLWSLLSLLPLLPVQPLTLGDATVTSAVAVEDGRLAVTIRIE